MRSAPDPSSQKGPDRGSNLVVKPPPPPRQPPPKWIGANKTTETPGTLRVLPGEAQPHQMFHQPSTMGMHVQETGTQQSKCRLLMMMTWTHEIMKTLLCMGETWVPLYIYTAHVSFEWSPSG